MMRVPGSKGNLLEVKAEGADIRMVYSPLDALRIARENPDREVVFYAIGFETTAPSTALTLQRAKKEGIENFSVFCNHVTIVPPVRASGLAGSAPRRLHRAGARLDGDRLPPLRVHARRLRQAVRGGGVRAAGPCSPS